MSKTFEIAPGLTVNAYKSETYGGWVIQIDGSPPGDEDCENVRVFLNDGYAAEWVGIDDPRYGKT